MREDWARSQPVLELDSLTVEGLIAPLFPGRHLLEVTPVDGGLTNSNFRVTLSDPPTPFLLRLYQRSGDLAQREMALCRMIGGKVAVPAYLHYAPENPGTGHAFAVIAWVDGKPLQSIRETLNDAGLAELGAATGRLLANLHSFAFQHFGFLDRDLQPGAAIDLDGDALVGFLHKSLVDGLGGERLGVPLTQAVIGFAKRDGHRVEAWQERACLVHGDLNLSNLLVRQSPAGAWEIAALIDWEYAFAGTPAFDFGNLLRPPLDHAGAFVDGLEAAYRGAGGTMPADWRRIARITDLFAYAAILNDPNTSDEVIADAAADITAIIADA